MDAVATGTFREPDHVPAELRGPRVFDAFGAEPNVEAAAQTAMIESIRSALAR